MAFSVSTDFLGKGLGFIVYHGSFSGAPELCNMDCNFESTLGDTPTQLREGPSGSYSENVSCPKDIDVTWRASVYASCISQLKHGSYSTERTYADAASFPSGLTPGTPTTTTCPVSGSVNVNTNQSSGSVNIEYRVQGTSPWLIGPTVATGLQGTPGTTALGGTLSALSPGTTYEARYHVNRNTANAQDAYSSIGTFTTQASVPVIIEPPTMDVNIDFQIPTILVAASPPVSIQSPVFGLSDLTFRVEMPLPLIFIPATNVLTRTFLMSDAVERDFKIGGF